jgi:hypothetical protein
MGAARVGHEGGTPAPGAALRRLALALAAVALAGTPAPAVARAGWARIATDVKAFATDRYRYAAWQRPGAPITVLDTATGRRSAMAKGCELQGGQGEGADGRFLVGCGTGLDLLAADDGRLTPLLHFEYGSGPVLARSYVFASSAATGSRCGARPTHDGCMALYEIATGVSSVVPQSRAVDLDEPGARPVCPALRHELYQDVREEAFWEWSYERGRLAALERIGERPVSLIRIERCHGRPTVLHTRPLPQDLELGGGVLTWASITYPPEPESLLGGEEGEAGEFEAFFPAEHRRWTAPIPRTRVALELCGTQPSTEAIFGEPSHTASTAFWAAGTGVRCGPKGTPSGALAYDIYAQPLR